MQHAVDDAQNRQGYIGGSFFQNLHEEREHVVAEVSVSVVEILHHALGPLETLFAEGPTTVQGHYRTQILELLSFFCTYLKNKFTQTLSKSCSMKINK